MIKLSEQIKISSLLELLSGKNLNDEDCNLENEKIPFPICNSWKWVVIDDIFDHCTGKALNSAKERQGHLLKYLTTSNVYWNTFKLDNLKEMYFKDSEIEKCKALKGDLLICEGGDVGRAAIWNYDYEIYLQNHLHKLRPKKPLVVKYYYYIFLLYKNMGIINGKGIGLKGLSSKALGGILVPFPPVEIQKQIVEKLDSLITKIDEFEKIENKLIDLKNEFPNNLKESLLQAAFSGKLTENENFGNGFNLVDEIRKERNSFPKVKNIISEENDEDILERWDSIKLGECLALIKGEKIDNCKLPYLEAKYLRGKGSPKIYTSGNFVAKGTPVILVDGENSGEVFIEPEDGIIGSTFKILFIPKCLDAKYVLYFIQKNRYLLRNNKKGAAIPHLNKDIFNNLVLPIPSLDEQKFIVEKLDQLLPLCDKLADLN